MFGVLGYTLGLLQLWLCFSYFNHAKLIHFANQPKLFPSVMNGHGEVAFADHACLW